MVEYLAVGQLGLTVSDLMVMILACGDLGRRFDDLFHTSIVFLSFFFFVLKWGSARAHQFHFLGQGQSTLAQRADTTVAECSLTS